MGYRHKPVYFGYCPHPVAVYNRGRIFILYLLSNCYGVGAVPTRTIKQKENKEGQGNNANRGQAILERNSDDLRRRP